MSADTMTVGNGGADGLAGLEHVAAQADSLGAASVPVEEGGTLGAPPPVDYGMEASGAVATFASLVGGFSPKAGELWTEAVQIRTAAALAPVMQKYNFTFGNLPVELTFAIVAGPVLWQTSRVIGAQMAAEKAAKPMSEKGSGPKTAAPPPDPNAINPGIHEQVKLYQQ